MAYIYRLNLVAVLASFIVGLNSAGQAKDMPAKAPAKLPPAQVNESSQSRPIPPQFRPQILNKEVTLPALPAYGSHAKFLKGSLFPGPAGSSAYYLKYTCDDSANTVLNWYKDNLKKRSWKISETEKRKDYLTATKDNLTCQVLAKGDKNSAFIVTYLTAPKGKPMPPKP